MICNVKRKLLPRIRCKRVLFNLLYFETSAYQVQISSNSPTHKNTVGPELDKFLEIEIFHLIMAIVMTPVLAFLVLLVLNRANSTPCRSTVSTSVSRGLFLSPFFHSFLSGARQSSRVFSSSVIICTQNTTLSWCISPSSGMQAVQVMRALRRGVEIIMNFWQKPVDNCLN